MFSTALADLASAEDPCPILADRKECREVREAE